MSWLFSQALVEEYSEANCLDGEQSAPSNGTPTHGTFWSPDKTTDASTPSRSGMTFRPSTDTHGEAVLMWCLEGFPAKTSVALERALESTENDLGCGWKWPESFAKWHPATSSWKTRQCSLLEGLDEFSETWPRWGIMRDGECLVQSMPEHLIREIGSGFWLTPTCMNIEPTEGRRESRELFRASIGRKDAPGGLAEQVATPKFWPTPRSQDAKHGSCTDYELSRDKGKDLLHVAVERAKADDAMDRTRRKVNSRGEPKLSAEVKLWPTPKCSDSRHAKFRHLNAEDNHWKDNLGEVVSAEVNGGSLNPTWVEWLMGWPLGWTDCAQSATDKFQQWQHSHGIS